ncbi:MAG: nuclear transport factor 2 family protein [Hyphomicrobiales bacterium]|nr:MAG: nuclear transport factor 2 family protein [Hyphomicrobiales bacterium]
MPLFRTLPPFGAWTYPSQKTASSVRDRQRPTMTTAREIVRDFYDKLSTGDAPGALGLMAPDIERTTMWHYRVDGRRPERVADGLFKPLMAEWSGFSLAPTEFIAEGETVVSLGEFTGVHGATGKTRVPAMPTSGPFVTARKFYIGSRMRKP